MKLRFGGLQQLGRALMLPIAVLPIAGLLLRLGQPDLLGWPAMAAAGDAVFSNLGLLFAVGVGVGLARENHGAAGLAALVGFLVTTRAVETLLAAPPGTPGQTQHSGRDCCPASSPASATTASATSRLPSYLSFFGGRRFVPIVSGLAGLVLAACDGLCVALSGARHGRHQPRHFRRRFASACSPTACLNRILIVTGLHHILNNFAWFIVGDYHGATGDLKRFFAGDPTRGRVHVGLLSRS